MEAILKKITDPYERKARLYPAVLTLLPAIILIALYTDWFAFKVENALYITVAAAALLWLTGKTRDLGKAVEHRLVTEWEGMPSVTLLRHRDGVLDRYTTQRYHNAAVALADVSLPDLTEEENDPIDADQRYRAVTSALLSKTRDTSEYPLLFKENINYGFWRNLRGVKPIACAFAISLIAFGLWVDRVLIVKLQPPEGTELTVTVTGIMLLFAWVTTVTDGAVRRAAQNYTLRLLEALDKL